MLVVVPVSRAFLQCQISPATLLDKKIVELVLPLCPWTASFASGRSQFSKIAFDIQLYGPVGFDFDYALLTLDHPKPKLKI